VADVLKRYVDSNVILQVGERHRSLYKYTKTIQFLTVFESDLVIGPVVATEVRYQIIGPERGKYKNHLSEIKDWLERPAHPSSTPQQANQIAELADAYRRAGWDGRGGDKGDREHAAFCSVHRISVLVTWENRFAEQVELISSTNRDQGISHRLGIFKPDACLESDFVDERADGL